MRRHLALDASPTLGAPLRFFLNAPVFASLAAALLLYAGPSTWATRWSPYALAATHLMTLGVFASVMMGALMQILPVVAGVHVASVRRSAAGIHALLTFGTLALALAFISSETELFPIAALACGAAALWFVVACAIGLARASSAAVPGVVDILHAVRLALAALIVTVALGATLAVSLTWPMSVPVVALTDLHWTWGLAGWIGLLTVGIAYQVIPMFQVTEPYPRLLARAFAPLAFLTLVLASLSNFVLQALEPAATPWFVAQPFAGYVVFAVVTLVLLGRRKRIGADTTTLYWRTSMVSIVCGALTWAIASATHRPSLDVTIGVLLLVGVVASAINGMLYKIVPFLLWYHLQASIDERSPLVPKMKTVLPDSQARRQYWAHLCALLMLLAASAWPAALARPAAFVFGVSSVWLGVDMARAMRIYLRVKRELSLVRAGGTQL
ncbi:hypothetical protein [Trinickia acidisoli]|uniref:hypothetical protein n=1 Tax=Trinickia acidisoli TaxID=2767482 RepID=UPI001A8D0CF5|nr:hypothetical protein [Trinickia acidisoli]